jgi:hypothetical protein
MNEPINHHYVSQCQSKYFFNRTRGRIFVLDKATNKISDKQTTKTLFSEDDSNTRTNDDLTLNRKQLEDDLKTNFEDHYERHYKVIQDSISNPDNPPIKLKESLIALTKFAIIGELRHPMNKRGNDDAISKALFERVLPQAAPHLKQELLDLKHRLSKTKYSNSIIYSQIADESFRLMGDIKSLIHMIDCNKFFFLPDTSAIRRREKINTYFNPDIKEIAMVGIPLSSKVFLHSQSIKLGHVNDAVVRINEGFPGGVERINYGLYDNSYKQVACEDYDYLVQFRDNLDSIRQMSLGNE